MCANGLKIFFDISTQKQFDTEYAEAVLSPLL